MPSQPRPNILVILADQLRRAALSCYGDPNIHTPNIDTLAERGVRFANACSTYPICVPFRFTFMTGQTAHSRLISSIGDRMSPAERTIADEFNDAGYHTCYFGKWHLDGGPGGYVPWAGGVRSIAQPIPHSRRGRWQHWFVDLGKGENSEAHFNHYFQENDQPIRCHEGCQTNVIFDRAMRHLAEERPKDKPFCGVLSFSPPHHPYAAPPEYEEIWQDRDLQLPANFLAEPNYNIPTPDWGENAWPKDRDAIVRKLRSYYAMVQHTDDQIGRMLTFLAEQGLEDNTVIVFSSDHGEMGGALGLPIQAKSYPFEESAGIPLLIADPRPEALHDTVLPQPTCTEDFYPTLCGLAGITPRQTLPGADLSTLTLGRSDSLNRRGVMLEVVYDCRPGFTFHTQYYRAFRSERSLYAVLGEGPGAEPWFLLDLQTDPTETNNVLQDPAYQDIAAQHHGWLREELIRTEDHFRLKPAFGYEGYHWDNPTPNPILAGAAI